MTHFSIGIVTYKDRFDLYFKPLLLKIKELLPEVEVIVQVNGDYNKDLDETYRRAMLEFCAEYPRVYPNFWTEFRSLSKLWNACLVNSRTNLILVLNDDIDIWSGEFFEGVEAGIKNFEGATFKINGSWSHFLANRDEIESYHWFDETLLGVGNEDGDMQLRIEQRTRKEMPNWKCRGIQNIVCYNNPLPGMKKYSKKYSEFNLHRFLEKIDLSKMTEDEKKEYWENRTKIPIMSLPLNAYPHERYWWNNKHKLGE